MYNLTPDFPDVLELGVSSQDAMTMRDIFDSPIGSDDTEGMGRESFVTLAEMLKSLSVDRSNCSPFRHKPLCTI